MVNTANIIAFYILVLVLSVLSKDSTLEMDCKWSTNLNKVQLSMEEQHSFNINININININVIPLFRGETGSGYVTLAK